MFLSQLLLCSSSALAIFGGEGAWSPANIFLLLVLLVPFSFAAGYACAIPPSCAIELEDDDELEIEQLPAADDKFSRILRLLPSCRKAPPETPPPGVILVVVPPPAVVEVD